LKNLKEKRHKLVYNLKSQMEIMGLVVIVILVSIAMLFVIRFVILQAPEEHKAEYVSMEMASNLISAILKTTNPDCYDRTFRELLQDCAENPSDPSIRCPNGQNSCTFVRGNLDNILSQTLDVWKIKYHLWAINEGSSIPIANIDFTEDGAACLSEDYTSKDTKLFPIPIGTGGGRNLNVELSICR